MALTRCEAVVVRTYPLGDTSRIAVLYSREFGLVRGVAKGARGPKSKFGAGLEPLSVVDVVLYRKEGRELDLLSKVDVLFDWRSGDLARVTHAQAVLEFLDRLVHEVEPDPALYALVTTALALLREAEAGTLASVTIAFQLQAAALLGYGPELAKCAGCGRAAAQGARFVPALGGVACASCGEGQALSVAVSPPALDALRTLQAVPLVTLEPFATPCAGEMLRLVELHLKNHVQRFAGFKSLALLLSLEGHAA